METIKIISLLVLGIACRFLWFINSHKDDQEYFVNGRFSHRNYWRKRWTIASLHICSAVAFTLLMPEAMPHIEKVNKTLAQFAEILGSFGVGLFSGIIIEKLLSAKLPFKK